jgi:TonB family protein
MKHHILQSSILIAGLAITPFFIVPAQTTKQKQSDPPNILRKANNALLASATNRVEAVYSQPALMARAVGTVFVEVTIDESGSVTSARALSGPPLLREAAVGAAQGWTFQPTTMQGKPVKVVGTLTFTFNLPEYVLRDRLIERLKQQIATSPNNPKLHYRLGRAYQDNEQFVEALNSYQRAIDLKPDYGDALVATGAINMSLNRYDEALNAYNDAVLLDLTREIKANAFKATGIIHFRREEFQEAVEPFKQAISLAPQDSLYFILALNYLKLGEKDSAMAQYLLLKEINSILAQQLLKQINEIQ